MRIKRHTHYVILLSTVGFLSTIVKASAPASCPTRPVLKNNANPDDVDDIDLLCLEIPNVLPSTRHLQDVKILPYAATVITDEDIRAAGARNVVDALRLVPGIDVADISYNVAAISPRGLHGALSHGYLILVDGRQIFDSFYGGNFLGNWPFQLEDIDRIEVVRGPGGVTWGANAVNGIIHIITKDPADQLGLTVSGQGGSRGSNIEHLGYAFQDKKLRMRISGEHEGTDGYYKGGSFLRDVDNHWETGRMGVHAIYDATPNDKLTISAGNAIGEGGFSPSIMTGLTGSKGANSQASFLLGRWEHRITDDNKIHVSGYFNDFHDSPAYKVNDYRYQQYALQFGQTFQPAENHTFMWGIDSRADCLDTSNADPSLLNQDYVNTAVFGLYAQDEWRFAPNWRLNLGARIDYEFYTGFQPSGRASLSYDLTNTSMLYAAVSRAFQTPPVGSRFLYTPFMEGLVYATSDQDIKPETLIAYELGYRATFFDKLQTNVNLYCHDYDDLAILKLMPGPPGLVRNNFQNGYPAWMYGVEMDARYDITKNLTLFGNYTLQLMEAGGVHSISESDNLTPPKHKFTVGARYRPIDRVLLSAHLYYVDDVESPNTMLPTPFTRDHIDEYFRLDLRAEYEFWKDTGWIAVGVRNLLDPNHPEATTAFHNYAEVPRMVYAEMRMTFK